MPAKKEVLPTGAELEEEILRYTLRLEALKTSHMRRMEEVAQTRAEERELRSSLQHLESAFNEARGERFDIVSDFTRQYKATEDELIGRCTALDNTITDLRDQQELAKLALAETEKERDHYIELKEREIKEQDSRMKEMEEEFRVMLADTQNRMSDRVGHEFEGADNGDDGDGEGDVSMEGAPPGAAGDAAEAA
eukprot:CAMPEP_0174853484 /NCGR_PEP_ID=MMETSP1114-20130205/28671_1 /TAXON_ID=312471 /ORGANISM="Neobodo designis, Strain CCAP 1951/1" /LENGTH=193 /DNA_ID=CAMNT_0016088139 /DNA_START=37 /DNA_END=618 /DNA_ORIENTATION=+